MEDIGPPAGRMGRLDPRRAGLWEITDGQRQPVRPRRDYTYANSTGSRGVRLCWTLDSGRLYELLHRESMTRWATRTVTVTHDGDVIDLTPEEVRQWRSDRSASMS